MSQKWYVRIYIATIVVASIVLGILLYEINATNDKSDNRLYKSQLADCYRENSVIRNQNVTRDIFKLFLVAASRTTTRSNPDIAQQFRALALSIYQIDLVDCARVIQRP